MDTYKTVYTGQEVDEAIHAARVTLPKRIGQIGLKLDNLQATVGAKANSSAVGSLSDLQTKDKTSTVSAINEVNEKVSNIASGKYYGFYKNASELPASGNENGYAYVGATAPYSIYNGVSNGGTMTWTDSGSKISSASVADEEDITQDSNGKLSLKDRGTTDGMGYIILRKNKSFSSQVTQQNTIYEIRYVFDLDGASVTIPSGCTLKFDGGKLSNGTIVPSDTNCSFEYEKPFLENIVLSGTFKVNRNEAVDSDIFIDSNYSTQRIANMFKLLPNGNRLVFAKNIYNNVSTINVERDLDVDFGGSTINMRVDESTLLADSFLFMPWTARDAGSVLSFVKLSNVDIVGNPDCVYSSDNTYVGSGARRRLIQLFNVDSVEINNVSISHFKVGTTGTYTSELIGRYEMSSISVFHYRNLIIDGVVAHDDYADAIITSVPAVGDNMAIVRNCHSYYNYTGFFNIIDGRCEIYNNVIENFNSSALNILCYDSLIYNNRFIDGKRSVAVDCCEGGMYFGRNIRIFDNYAESSLCDICGQNIRIDNNTSIHNLTEGITISINTPLNTVGWQNNPYSATDKPCNILVMHNYLKCKNTLIGNVVSTAKNDYISNNENANYKDILIEGNTLERSATFSESPSVMAIYIVFCDDGLVIRDNAILGNVGRTPISSNSRSAIILGHPNFNKLKGLCVIENNRFLCSDNGTNTNLIYIPLSSEDLQVNITNNYAKYACTGGVYSYKKAGSEELSLKVLSKDNIGFPNISNLTSPFFSGASYMLESGDITFDTTNNRLVYWNGTAWVNMDGSALS